MAESTHRNWILTAFLIGLAILGIVLLVLGLGAFVAPSTSAERKDFVQAVGGLLSGLAAVVGLYFQWKTSSNRTKTNSTPSSDTRLEDLQEPREVDEVSDRFTRAVTRLGATDAQGNKRLEVRLVAIGELERISKESEQYYWPVMEVLTAYVRKLTSEELEQGRAINDYEKEVPTDIKRIMAVLRACLARVRVEPFWRCGVRGGALL